MPELVLLDLDVTSQIKIPFSPVPAYCGIFPTGFQFGGNDQIETALSLDELLNIRADGCAEKLRGQKSACWNLNIFLNTDVFKPELGEYYPNYTITLPSPCNASPRLVGHALQILKTIWRDGYTYKKAGVIVTGLVPENYRQLNLFAPDDDRHDRISLAMDTVNRRYGTDVLRVGAMGYSKRWGLRQESRSPRFTTRWGELPRVRN